MTRSAVLLCLMFFLCARDISAQDTAGLFRAVVPVRSQSNSDRQYAAQKGMQEVLVRMSGSEGVLLNQVVQRAVGSAQTYILQFQYRPVDDKALLAKGYRQALSMLFSRELIERLLLKEARVSYWPPNRPEVLLWLVEDDNRYGRQMLNPDTSAVAAELEQVAQQRGLPLAWPLLDLEDQSAINANLLWRLDEESILRASQRYGAEVILAGKLYQSSVGEYRSTWVLLHRGQSKTWESRSSELESLAWDALQPPVNYLVSLTGVVPSDESAIVLLLHGVDNFKSYSSALEYLQGLAMVSDVRLLETRPGEMLLALDSEATVAS